jgi:hypothetical protein
MQRKSKNVTILIAVMLLIASWNPRAQGTPGAPSGLQATVNGVHVTLTWSAPSTSAAVTSYLIEAGSTPGASNLAQLSTGSPSTLFAVNAPAGVYFVRVRALSGELTGPPSNDVTVTVGGSCAPPAPPVSLTSSVSGAAVALTWQPGSGASSYVVEAGSSSGLSDLASIDTGSSGTSFSASAPPGTYFVSVRARNACGTSAPSAERIVVVGGGCSLPAAPGVLDVFVDGTRVRLSWGGAPGNPPGYVVEVGSTAGASDVAQIDVGYTQGAAGAPPPGTSYLRVRARNACGMGPATNEVAVHSPSNWLPLINAWRGRAGVAALVEEPDWSAGATLHSRYLLETSGFGEDFVAEDSSSRFFTPAGNEAALNSTSWKSLYANFPLSGADYGVIDYWAANPFVGLQILDPVLRRTGLGYASTYRPPSQRAPYGVAGTAAVLDLKRGRDTGTGASYPTLFPANGTVIPANCRQSGAACGNGSHGGADACGFQAPNPFTAPEFGFPVWLQFGPGVTPVVSAATLTSDGVTLPVCTFNADTFTDDYELRESLGRDILRDHGAVVLLPRNPLPAGKSYTASLTVAGKVYQTTFRVQ